MSVSIDILPFTNVLELEGEPDPSSAYSLSGNIAITINNSSSVFDRRRTVNLLLGSLVVTFEGQTELVTPETGYTSYRLCSIAKELVPADPVELSNEDHESSDKPCTWNVLYNLVIPGWLPPSSSFGDCENGPSGIRYGLHATAKFASKDQLDCQMPFATSFWSSLCMSLGSKPKDVRAPRREISIHRFMAPEASCSSSTAPFKTFCVQVHDDKTSVIPTGVLSKIKVTASVPEQIDMEEDSFQLRLRIRAQDLDPVHCERLRMSNFTVDVQQLEKYRTKSSRAYTSRFPVPPESSQPPNVPLLTRHPLEQLSVLGMFPDATETVIDRTVSLNPEDASGLYQLSGDGYIFTPGAETTDGTTCTWYAMEPSIPFSQRGTRLQGGDWLDECTVRASGSSPLFVARHQIVLSMLCTYDVDGDRNNRVTAKLQFVLPVQFARMRVDEVGLRPGLAISPVHSRSLSREESQTGTPTDIELPGLSPLTPYYYANTLPAYSQLFDSNGDRKIDYNLPVYTPYPPSSPLENEQS